MKLNHLYPVPLILLSSFVLSSCLGFWGEAKQIERGRYLITIAGCNDCHTANYLARGEEIPESEWLTGDTLGYQGPWGTVYPSNLRLLLNDMSEDQWVSLAGEMRSDSPMAWSKLGDITTDDLRAIYRYVRYLGPAGQPAPAPLPPGAKPETRVIPFMLPH